MLNFIVQHGGTILISIILIAAVAVVIFRLHRDKRDGKCSCGCENCPSSGICHKKQEF